jgi:hypothetical protein
MESEYQAQKLSPKRPLRINVIKPVGGVMPLMYVGAYELGNGEKLSVG